ncbi:unnamed protein product [Brassicogethes aeneus]|uniref:Uncharacterized protein n=1 Tax=Brassicogethes aeneus TaxID=1431903 RepID=A0A9P0BEX6_BRAAE|nr:unnamed protein product [Brassicogethes aeneus]
MFGGGGNDDPGGGGPSNSNGFARANKLLKRSPSTREAVNALIDLCEQDVLPSYIDREFLSQLDMSDETKRELKIAVDRGFLLSPHEERQDIDNKTRIISDFKLNTIKCSGVNCDITLHSKCFDNISKIIKIQKDAFYCKSCEDQNNYASPYLQGKMDILAKEVECLQREKELLSKYISEIEFSNNLLKSNYMQQNNQQKNVSKKGVNSLVSTSVHSYATAAKNVNTQSAVLFVKCADEAISNKQIEKAVKSKINPSSLNINIVNTKLIKNGMLISCKDNDSLQKLKSNLDEQIGNVYSVTEAKKYNPRIIVYGTDDEVVDDSKFISNLLKDNNLDFTENDLKLITKISSKSLTNVVLEVIPSLFKSIMDKV